MIRIFTPARPITSGFGLSKCSARKFLPQKALPALCASVCASGVSHSCRGARSGAVCTMAQLGATTSKLPYSHGSHAQLNMHDGM